MNQTAQRSGAPGNGLAQALRQHVTRVLTLLLTPLVRLLAAGAVTPNQVSWAGASITCCAALLVAADLPVWGGWVFLAGSLLDLLDGALARQTGQVTAAGALLDSTLDRITEGALLAAIAYRFAMDGFAPGAALVVLALLTSQLVSYLRARSEGLGIECKGGLVTRAERVILLTAGLVLDVLVWAVGALLLLSTVTAVQRYRHCARALPSADDGPAAP